MVRDDLLAQKHTPRKHSFCKKLSLKGHKMKRLTAVLLILLFAALQVPGTTKAQGTSVTMAFLESEPDKLDTVKATSVDDYQVLWNVCEGLVGYDSKTLTPDKSGVAESWDISADGLTYTFHLRKGVKFHNGREMTADDVVYSFNRLANPDVGTSYTTLLLDHVKGIAQMREKDAAKRAKALEGVKAVDPSTVQITLDSPVSSFLNQLTLPGGFVVAKEAAESPDFNEHPVCTGPYSFTEWKHGESITLTANPDYWGGKPEIEKVTLRVIRESSQQTIEFEAGNLDIAGVSPADLPRLRDDAKLSKELLTIPTLNVFHLRINLGDKALSDIRVRKAVAMGIDRKAIVDTILNGQGTPAHGLVPIGLSAYDPKADPFPYNPDEAKKLLADAGYKDGLTLEVRTQTVETELRTLAAIQQQLAKIGVTLKINSTERALFSQDSNACKAQFITIFWSQDYPDPENFDGLLFTTSTSPTNSRNNCGYGKYEGSAEIKDLLAKATAMPLGPERDALYRQIEAKAIGEKVLVIPLYHASRPVLANSRLQGTIVDANAMARFKYITLAK
jgi:oligopeptide transport system substrate-binding protein